MIMYMYTPTGIDREILYPCPALAISCANQYGSGKMTSLSNGDDCSQLLNNSRIVIIRTNRKLVVTR